MQLGAVCYLLVSYLLIFLSNQFLFSLVFLVGWLVFISLTPVIWCPLPIKRIFNVICVKAEDCFVLSFLFLPFMAITFFCLSSFWLILHDCVFVVFQETDWIAPGLVIRQGKGGLIVPISAGKLVVKIEKEQIKAVLRSN